MRFLVTFPRQTMPHIVTAATWFEARAIARAYLGDECADVEQWRGGTDVGGPHCLIATRKGSVFCDKRDR